MIAGLLERLRELRRRRAELVGINRRNVELVYAHNRRRDYVIADDKLVTKDYLRAAGVPVPETLAVCDGLFAVPGVVEAFRDDEHFVVKPANGSGGNGILVVGERLAPGLWRSAGGRELGDATLRQHLASIVFGSFSSRLDDRVFIERRIVPHAAFHELWPDGLCDVRVITLRGRPLMSMVRVPTRRARGRANLHQGGIGLAVDLATGRTFHAYSQGASLTRHPESGADLVGIVVPEWAALLDLAHRAAAAVPLGYLGIDLVVDRALGPLVLEINARPGLEIQNVNQKGLWPAMTRSAA